MTTAIQTRRDTASTWTATNPVLAVGEQGLETDTLKTKFGDGATAWNSLGYASAPSGALAAVATSGDYGDLINKPVLSFVYNNIADRDAALPAPPEGQKAYIKDLTGNGTPGECVFNGARWRNIWSEWEDFVPNWGGITVGNSTKNIGSWCWTDGGNGIRITAAFYLGSTSSVDSTVTLTLTDIVPSAILANNGSRANGVVTFDNTTSTQTNETGTFTTSRVNSAIGNVRDFYGDFMNTSVPFTWDTDDELLLDVVWPVA